MDMEKRTAGELIEHFSRLPADCEVIFTAMVDAPDGKTLYADQCVMAPDFDVRDRDDQDRPKLVLIQLGGDGR